MSDLPPGWALSTVGEVSDRVVVGFVGPARRHYVKDGIPFLMGKNIRSGVIDLSDLEQVSQAFHFRERKSQLRPGDVVVVRIGRSGEAAVISSNIAQANCGGLVIVKQPRAVLPEYLAWYLNSPGGLAASRAETRGITRQTLNTRSVEAAAIPVPPLAEQKRIVLALQSYSARIAHCRESLHRVPEILKRFRESVLDAAVSGSLTQEWRKADFEATQEVRFEDSILRMPRSWSLSPLSELISESRPLCYGVVQPGAESPSGVNLIRIQDLEAGTIRSTELRAISADIDKEYRRSRVQGGDLLVSVVGTIGRTALVPPNLKANIARAIARIACRRAVDPRWVKLWLDSPTLQWWLNKSSREVARKTLNLSELGKIVVGIPSEAEQREIVCRAEALLRMADSIEDRVRSARVQSNTVSCYRRL